MIFVDDKYSSKKEAVNRCENALRTANVIFADGSFKVGKDKGGYAFVSIGENNVYKTGIDIANSPVDMELQAIKHSLIYLNNNKFNNDLDIIIFNDCLQAISKIKKYIQNPNKSNKILNDIFLLLLSLNNKNLFIYWVKKETLSYHLMVDSLSKSARDFIK